MKYFASFTILLFLASSCIVSPPVKVNLEGVSFTCPEGWKITDHENYFGFGNYIAIEKDGFKSSGIISYTWLNSESDLDDYLTELKVELKSSLFFRKSDLSFGEAYESSYNYLDTKTVDYHFTLFKVEHKGIIYLANEAGKTICILKQEAIQDSQENKAGYDKLERSFKVLQGI